MHELLCSFGLKRPSLCIRIAGTNGKGSTAFMLSNALQACGLNVGLYTSPHLHHFNERIRINGEPLPDRALIALMEKVMPIALEIGASYFEVATAIALKHFSDSEVDVEVLEAGVGARLDATTAVDADMALITPIGLDHQVWLGDRLADIAQEKAHITDGCQFSISTHQVPEVASILSKHNRKLCFVEGRAFTSVNALGEHQNQNASLAWEAIQTLATAGLIHPDMLGHARAYQGGARLDATTAVDADMALITPIGLDHQVWLGDRLADIAQEKAHITDGCQFSISTHQVPEVASILSKHNRKLCFVEGRAFTSVNALGEHQNQNASLAWEAIQTLATAGLIHPDMLGHARAAIQKTRISGRLQKVQLGKATIWLDAAHNTHAIEALLPTLPDLAGCPFDAIFVYTREDRDLSDCIGLLKPFTKRMIGENEKLFDKSYSTIEMALEAECGRKTQGNYLVLGSFITVAAALNWLETD